MNILTLFILTFLIVPSLYKKNWKKRDSIYSDRKLCSSDDKLREQPLNRINTTARLTALRKLMSEIDAVLVTSDDEHQTSYVSESDKRRQYISGFSGSLGDALITKTEALLWTDGRYHLQADDELDCNWILMKEGNANVPSITEWLNAEFPNGAMIGADAKLIPAKVWNELEDNLKKLDKNFGLIDTPTNLIDAIWTDRPHEVENQAYVLDSFFTGKSWEQKISEVRKEIAKYKATAMVVTALDEISWLLNIRGSDVPYTGFLKAYVFLSQDDVVLYTDLKKNSRKCQRLLQK
ncbi:hypothetical protein ILUMI_11643 [Ignelater luminosus]|uniref:Creatinase N-terminal domain-containing protein n=1 Tax=Ignelater luminosus TaxID=2038154 RepID=A0A8K0CVN3_IGNLU|nr:hypothetical protein ILUMI_11643 [Ignelater luminosus]